MTPATSVTVIDIVDRNVLGEISLPGCALTYPTGQRGFSTLCGDGSLISYQIDEAGGVASQNRIEPFNDIDNDAMFEEATIINGVAFFPTFAGNVREINLTADTAALGELWPLVPAAERAGNWRPGGLQLTGADPNGRLYVLMHQDGREGSHKEGGSEVWVYDVATRSRVQRITLENWGITLELTQSDEPLLLVVNTEMNIDVYESATGNYLRTLQDLGQETILVMHAVK